MVRITLRGLQLIKKIDLREAIEAQVELIPNNQNGTYIRDFFRLVLKGLWDFTSVRIQIEINDQADILLVMKPRINLF